ncbi:MAG: HEAT repeat domain-containing protein [Planctomycetes bacterium]|nr:HEAT repeat domain-containing protein [Planctomycetota bacterium]
MKKLAFAVLALTVIALTRTTFAAPLDLGKGDHICLVGNALGERMQHHNYWESLLHQRFSKHELVVRNLCFPADEITVRPRSQNFGSPDDHLKQNKADVVIYFFGFNEAFQGEKGLIQFKKDLQELVEHTRSQDYSGKGNAQVVLVSPIAAEDVGNKHIPNGEELNADLAIYTKAIAEVAEASGATFVDVFAPTLRLFDASDEQLTSNSVHFNEAGYQKFAFILDKALFGRDDAPSDINLSVKAETDDKNFHWWHRYRAVNGFSIYGKRGEAGFEGTYRNRDVMERELAILDQMTANREARVWKIARGERVAAQVDDSDTLPFLNVKSNVGTDFENKGNDQKRGQLTYLPAKEQLKHFKLADGYEINLVASEEQFPELANPISLNFDSKGRLWVSTMSSYPHWQPKSKLDDKLLIFEDHDGDGDADECKTFAGGLHQPTGFELGQGGAYVAVQPDILFLKDTDGDDKADVRVRQLVGFDTADSHHGLGAFEWSPGGTLHCMEGIFKFSGIETYNGPIRSREGAVWSYQPRSEQFDIYSTFNFTNPWGHVFDKWGQDFVTDGTSGQHFYMTPITGRLDFPNRLRGRRNKKEKPYPQFLEKIARPSAGVEIVSSRNFPEEAQGDYLVNNVIGLLGIMQYGLKDDGSGIGGDYKGNLVECTYGNFRPVDLQFGPDGALYICDWQNALIGHLQHNLRDPNRDHSHGRIWRIRYAGNELVEPGKIAGVPTSQLVNLLKAPEDRTRYRTRRELASRDTAEVVPAVASFVASLDASSDADQHHLLEALWVQQSHVAIDESLLKQLLRSSDFHARAAATDVLALWRAHVKDPLALLKVQANDEHPRVRLEAVRACSFFRSPEAAEVALEVLNHRTDKYIEFTLDETMRQLEQF